MTNAFIAGVAGEALSPAEASFFRAASPAGLILFARNCVAHDQIRRLILAIREAVGGDDTDHRVVLGERPPGVGAVTVIGPDHGTIRS